MIPVPAIDTCESLADAIVRETDLEKRRALASRLAVLVCGRDGPPPRPDPAGRIGDGAAPLVWAAAFDAMARLVRAARARVEPAP